MKFNKLKSSTKLLKLVYNIDETREKDDKVEAQ